MESTGQHPQIGWKIPDQMRYYHVAWPTIDALTDAFYKLCESRACHSLIRIPPDCTNFFLTPTNNDCVRMFNEGSLPIQRGKHDNALNVILAGHTTREIDFNDEVFKEIVADTGGEFVKLSREQEELLFLNQMNAVYVPRINRTTGSGATVFGVEESADIWPKLTGICADISEKGVADGSMEDHGREALWAWPMEGRYLHAEDAILLDEKKPNVGDTLMKFMMGAMRLISTEALGIQALPGLTGDMLANVVGPQYCNANVWMRRVRDLVDPSRVADYSWHISPEPAVPSAEGSRKHEEKGSRKHEDMRLLFQSMQASFNPRAAGDLQTVIQFQVTGSQPGNWYFSIEKGACTLVEGVSGAPTVTINTPSEVWLAIANKEVSPPVMLMEGKVKVEGNLSMLMQMENIFGS
jgi:putative sterol carrier protein